ncbi:MAG TPA: MFS transporter [Anaerolineae bacterium]|nr:MFS transporter [Anaerolineae bacterium]HOQ97830.1 MFS transporter [Anaerolineae bacterium]HPL30516.1 MFS transporter [Anaerolineae bacterium]
MALTLEHDGLPTRYPRQFWVLLGGECVSTIGRSMVFPFMTLYLHGRLGVPLTTAGALLTAFGFAGAIGQGIGGTLADRLGRKWVMAFSLLAAAAIAVWLAFATTVAAAAIALVLSGLLGSIYDPAAAAMVADMVAEEDRAQAYSIWRVTGNVAIAIGPAIGGFLASRSYAYAFGASALGSTLFMLLVALGLRETRPAGLQRADVRQDAGGYRDLLRDRPFMAFLLLFTLAYTVYSFVMTVMPVHMSDQHGLGEQYYGLVMTVNALIVVFLQFPMTRLVRKANRLRVMAAGALLFALATGSVTLAEAFPHFALVMVVLTLGENLAVPTATTVAADFAPPELRGRYMGALGFAWIIAWGAAPMLAGLLSDHYGPQSPWLAGAAAGVLVAAALWGLGGGVKRET